MDLIYLPVFAAVGNPEGSQCGAHSLFISTHTSPGTVLTITRTAAEVATDDEKEDVEK